MIGAAPCVSPDSGSIENCITLESIVIAPTARSPPYFSKDVLKDTMSMLSVDCMMKGDSPSARHGSSTLKSIFRCLFLILSTVMFPVRNLRTHNADTAWDIMVASAAPFTPMSSPKMKIGSSTIFSTAPTSTVIMLIFANP